MSVNKRIKIRKNRVPNYEISNSKFPLFSTLRNTLPFPHFHVSTRKTLGGFKKELVQTWPQKNNPFKRLYRFTVKARVIAAQTRSFLPNYQP